MQPLTERCTKNGDASVHNIQECYADIPTLLRVPPSKINSKESLDDGVDRLPCVRRSAECVASAAIGV